MRKNISSLLQRGNLKPKERVLLLVAHQVSKEKDGKSILTEADEHALSEGWTPANNEEAKEYNRYNEGWRLTGFAELDTQTTFLTAENNFLRASRLVDYTLWGKGLSNILKLESISVDKRIRGLDIEASENEALELIIKNSGLEVDKVIYGYAFESLSEDLKKDILALDPEAKKESQYLDQEETISNLFDGKDKLTREAKEQLANLILDSLYNDYFKEWWYSGFYAELSGLDILKKWADYNKINYEVSDKDLAEAEKKQKEAKTANDLIAGDKSLNTKEGKELRKEKLIDKVLPEKLKDYAEKHKTDIRDLLKQTILRWLDEGLFVKEYTPIFNSDTKETCNDAKTKLPHKELFKEWLKAKKKAKETIQELIDKGELKVEERNWEMKGIDLKKPLKIITGESLYNLKGDFTFAKDFKKEVEAFKGLGFLILFLRKCRFMKDYAILLAFKELFKKLSKIYEIDLTYKIDKWIADFKNDIDQLNHELILIEEKISEAVYHKHDLTFLKETFFKDMLIDLEEVKPSDDRKFVGINIKRGEVEGKIGLAVAGIDRYYQEFKKLFDEEF